MSYNLVMPTKEHIEKLREVKRQEIASFTQKKVEAQRTIAESDEGIRSANIYLQALNDVDALESQAQTAVATSPVLGNPPTPSEGDMSNGAGELPEGKLFTLPGSEPKPTFDPVAEARRRGGRTMAQQASDIIRKAGRALYVDELMTEFGYDMRDNDKKASLVGSLNQGWKKGFLSKASGNTFDVPENGHKYPHYPQYWPPQAAEATPDPTKTEATADAQVSENTTAEAE